MVKILLPLVLVWCVCQGVVVVWAQQHEGPLDLDKPIDLTEDVTESSVQSSTTERGRREALIGEPKWRRRETDSEREQRRTMEVLREREERTRGAFRKSESLVSLASIERERQRERQRHEEMERQRERERQEEIAREIEKAENRKLELLSQPIDSALHHSTNRNSWTERQKDRTRERERENWRERQTDDSHISLQRQKDRAERTWDVARDGVTDSVLDKRTSFLQRDHGVNRRLHDTHRKDPILILEVVTEKPRPEPHPDRHSGGRPLHGQQQPVWHGSSSSSSRPQHPRLPLPTQQHHRPIQDTRGSDHPVFLPRPTTTTTLDRRPDRPSPTGFPSRYDELDLTLRDHHIHPRPPVDPHHDHQGFPVTGVMPHPHPPLRPNVIPLPPPGSDLIHFPPPGSDHIPLPPPGLDHIPHLHPGSDLIPHPAGGSNILHHPPPPPTPPPPPPPPVVEAGLANVKAAEAQVALNQAIQTQAALQVNRLKQVVAAHLVGQAAQQALAQRLVAQQVAAGAASRVKAARLHAAGQVKTAIKTKLKNKIKDRLNTLIQDKVSDGVDVVNSGVQVVKVGQPILPVKTPITPFITGIREDLLHRLILLKPYFQHVGAGYTLPSSGLPDLPLGARLTPVQVANLPRRPIQVPLGVSEEPFHLPLDLKKVVEPPLDPEYIEYLLGLPSVVFHGVTNMSKREFLVTLFPRLYRTSVGHLSPHTTTGVLGQQLTHTPIYTPSTTPHPSGNFVFPTVKPPLTTISSYATPEPHHYRHHSNPSVKTPNPLYELPKPTTPAPNYGPPPKPVTPKPHHHHHHHQTATPTPIVPHVTVTPHDVPTTVHHPIPTTTVHHPIPTTTVVVPHHPISPPLPGYGAPKAEDIHSHEKDYKGHHPHHPHPHHPPQGPLHPHHDPHRPLHPHQGPLHPFHPHHDDKHHQDHHDHKQHHDHKGDCKDDHDDDHKKDEDHYRVQIHHHTHDHLLPPHIPFQPPIVHPTSEVPPHHKTHFQVFPTPDPTINTFFPGGVPLLTTDSSSSSEVTGVGLRPHGGPDTFLTPVTTPLPHFDHVPQPHHHQPPPPHPPTPPPKHYSPQPLHHHQSHIPPPFPTEFPPSFTSTYTSYDPLSSHEHSSTFHPSTIAPTTNIPIFFTTTTVSPPTTPNFPSQIPTTTFIPPRGRPSSNRAIITTTTRRPTFSVSTIPTTTPLPLPTTVTPANTPFLVVDEIPATPATSTIFRLTPSSRPGFRQQSPVGGFTRIKTVKRPYRGKTSTEDKTSDEEVTILLDSNFRLNTRLEKVLDGSLTPGRDLERIPGTDNNDDEHVLSPFTKRKGNATTNANPQMEGGFQPSLGLPSPHPLQSEPTQPTAQPATPTPITTPTTTTPSTTTITTTHPTTTLSGKKPPVPQRVGVNGLPTTPAVVYPTNPTPHLGFPGSSPGANSPPPLTPEILAQLPSYLKEAPHCATHPSNRSFCVMPHEYPSELGESLVKNYREELQEAWTVLSQFAGHTFDPTLDNHHDLPIDLSVECGTRQKNVSLSWLRDVLGSWFVVMQTPPFTQEVTITTCSIESRAKGCRPLLEPRPLIAFHPRDTQPRPFVFDFPLPVACVFPE